ncbi:MAG: hypothetical protein FWH03_04955 [Firmicutes bacterium]|nr:hypothetical protein [Bacillota bacterium]
MAFKSAFRIIIKRFGLAWTVALFILILALIIGALSLMFILPVLSAFNDAGITRQIGASFMGILNGSGNIGAEIQSIWTQIQSVFSDNRRLTLSTVILFFIVMFIYKFLLGFYELPLYQSLEGEMSSNLKVKFSHAFIAKLGISSRFILVKLIYTTLYDALFFLGLYYLLGLFFVAGGAYFAPIVILIYFVLFQALRYTLIAFWGTEVVLNRAPIFQSFAFSARKASKNFVSVFFSFCAAWLIIIALNVFIGIFTFGVGLMATIPVSVLFIAILNMTHFYTKTGRRYYADGRIITPKRVK